MQRRCPLRRLTPKFVIVGAAASLSAAVACFTQVTGVVVHSGTVLGTDNRPASNTPMMLHHLVDRTRRYTSLHWETVIKNKSRFLE